ncbi:hypothetical protein E3O67_01995 [Cryobacterium sp. TMT3-29-2]|nr:hypothetical protein E3O67_01995 [Cryobacterium sp. TMT3-29-2]
MYSGGSAASRGGVWGGFRGNGCRSGGRGARGAGARGGRGGGRGGGPDPVEWTPHKRECSLWQDHVGTSPLSTKTRP